LKARDKRKKDKITTLKGGDESAGIAGTPDPYIY